MTVNILLVCEDLIASDAQYQASCLAKLYKRAQLSRKDIKKKSEKVSHGIVFAEYIETYRSSLESRPIIKIADMKNLYITRLNEFGLDQVQVHTTRLKAAIPDLRSQTEGRDTLLTYDEDEQLSNKLVMMIVIPMPSFWQRYPT
mgnify:CR=1 FL=1